MSDKLGVIDNLLGKADRLLIGGGMVFTFLAAQGHEVGKSLLEADQLDTVRGYLARAEEPGVEIVLPVDIVVARRRSARTPRTTSSPPTRSPPTGSGSTSARESAQLFAAQARRREDGLLERPDGRVRDGAVRHGTRAVAQALTEVDGLTVVGGGDSAAAVRTLGFDETAFGHISTGGGASPGVPRGQDPPRHRRPGELTPMATPAPR